MYAWRTLALAHLGRFDEARCDHELGRADCGENGQPLALIELAYARGMTELLDPGAGAGVAEHWLRVALADARSGGMRLIELRATTALGRLWRQQGKPQQARELLAPLYGCFTEGFECTDLKEARALLEQLDAGR